MPFELSRFADVRPLLFHITRPENLDSIRTHRRLLCAARLFAEAGAAERVTEHRPTDPIPLRVGGRAVLVNDQRPLRERWIDFEPGWNLERFITHLNRRVFFWPGTESGPIPHGRSHADCYDAIGAIVIRARTSSVLAANPGALIEFSRHNSGTASPRTRPNLRGGNTFLPAVSFGPTASGVVEVTFLEAVELPADAELRNGPWNRWVPLFS